MGMFDTAWRVSVFGPYFPPFGRHTERYGVSLRIQSEYGKIRTRKLRIWTLFAQCETSLLNDFQKKNWKETHNMIVLYRWCIFHLEKRWRLVEIIFSILPEIQWKKEYEVSHKIWNITIYQNYQFIRRLHTLNQKMLSNTVSSNPQMLTSTLTQSLATLNIWSKTSQSQFLRVRKICSDTLLKSRKVMNI